MYECSSLLLVTSEKPNSGGRQQRQGGRFNDRERFNDRDRSDRQGDRLDNRTRQNEDRSSRGGRGGGRPRLSSREKDGVRHALVFATDQWMDIA